MPSPTTPAAPTVRSAIRRPSLHKSASAAGFITLAYSYLLAFNLLQQLAATTHAPAALPYLFLGAIDGFIALALFAVVRLRSARPEDEVYAWTLTALAIVVRAVTVLVFGVLGTRQMPGGSWQPNDVAVIVMSAGAPLMLVFAVHLYALITEHTTDLAQHGE